MNARKLLAGLSLGLFCHTAQAGEPIADLDKFEASYIACIEKEFADGCFEQQDAGSQLVAAALEVTPGMRVIDACAGAGGKTLHIAAMMEGKGRLLAMDVEEWKLENLKQRARRAGAHNVETRVITSSKTVKRLKESADRVLLDVPCSAK